MRNFIALAFLAIASFGAIGSASAQQGVHPHVVTGGTLHMGPDRPHMRRMPSMQQHMESRGVGRGSHMSVMQLYSHQMHRPIGGYARPMIQERIIILRMRMRSERRMF